MLEAMLQELTIQLGPGVRVVPASPGESLILTPNFILRCRHDEDGLEVALLLPHYADRRAKAPVLADLPDFVRRLLEDTTYNRAPAFCDRRIPLREALSDLMARHGWREHRASMQALWTTLIYTKGSMLLAFFDDARDPVLDWSFFVAGSRAAREILFEGPPQNADETRPIARGDLLRSRVEHLTLHLKAELEALARNARAVLELEHFAPDLLSGDDRPLRDGL